MASLIKTANAAYGVVVSNEGNYTSVNRDDNGALCIGVLQWHGERARDLLLKLTKAIDGAEALLCDMYGQIVGGVSWTNRILDEQEAERVALLLGFEEAKKIQDELAIRDICEDIERGMSYGLLQCGALIYFADGANQYGRYSELWKNASEIAKKNGGTLEALHSAILSLTEQKKQRRINTYEKVKRLPICFENVNDEETGEVRHTVVAGDTLGKLAKKYGTDIDSVLRANEKRYPRMTKNYIERGWELIIPKIKTESELMREYLFERGILDASDSTLDPDTLLVALYRIAKRI